MTDVARILNHAWPECFREMYRDWDQVEDLQGFLDSQVVWEVGQEHTAAEVLAAEAAFLADVATADQLILDDATDDAATRADTAIQALVDARPAQIENWIENNVTDLASAKVVLTRIVKVLRLIARNEFRD